MAEIGLDLWTEREKGEKAGESRKLRGAKTRFKYLIRNRRFLGMFYHGEILAKLFDILMIVRCTVCGICRRMKAITIV